MEVQACPAAPALFLSGWYMSDILRYAFLNYDVFRGIYVGSVGHGVSVGQKAPWFKRTGFAKVHNLMKEQTCSFNLNPCF